MPGQLEDAVRTIVSRLELAEGLSVAETSAFLCECLEELPTPRERNQPETQEAVKILLDSAGDITVATSLKLPNVKLRLGDFLFACASAVAGASSAFDDPVKLALVVLGFLRSVLKLSEVEIRREDAEVLLSIYRLTCDEGVATESMLLEVQNHVDDSKSLARLSQLGCITQIGDEIKLNETIVVKRQPQ